MDGEHGDWQPQGEASRPGFSGYTPPPPPPLEDRSTAALPAVPPPWPSPAPTQVLPSHPEAVNGSGHGHPRRVVRRAWRIIAIILAVLLAAAGGSGAYLTLHYRKLAHDNHALAVKWQNADTSQVAISKRLAGQLDTANGEISHVTAQLASANAQINSLQSQVAVVANQKEKALDTNSVLQQLLAAAGVVANDLQGCVSATDQFDTDLNNALFSGDTTDLGLLEDEASQVRQTCGNAEDANQQLQLAIHNAP